MFFSLASAKVGLFAELAKEIGTFFEKRVKSCTFIRTFAAV